VMVSLLIPDPAVHVGSKALRDRTSLSWALSRIAVTLFPARAASEIVPRVLSRQGRSTMPTYLGSARNLLSRLPFQKIVACGGSPERPSSFVS